MAMVYSENRVWRPVTVTTNVVKAAPVKWDQILYMNFTAKAVVVTAVWQMHVPAKKDTDTVRKPQQESGRGSTDVPEDAVLVASTGVIGRQIPMDLIKERSRKPWYRCCQMQQRSRHIWQQSPL